MRLSLSLFHCDTPGGNRTYEGLFQMFVCRKDDKGQLQVVSEIELGGLGGAYHAQD